MNDRKLYIWGWWQGNNLGDNWIKKTLEVFFPEACFIDTSVKKFDKNSFVICGGGGLFIYDVIDPWKANQKNIKYGILGLGAEFPHETMDAVKVYNKASFFYVRDRYSAECMHLSDIERSYDLTFALPLKWTELSEEKDNKVFFVWRDGHELLQNTKFHTYICPDENNDSYIIWHNTIKSLFSQIIEDDFQTKDNNIDERMSDCDFVISGRYHGVVAAIQKGLPFIAIDICPKIRSLLKECGLEEYCIKISETNKIETLIRKAKNNIIEIRNKEKEYVKLANSTLLYQIENARLEVLKVLKPLNIIHYGSYWMKKNDVVNAMADDLADMCHLKKINLRIYTKHPSRRISSNIDTPNGKQCIVSKNSVLNDIRRFKADAIVLNSGGLYLEDETFEILKNKKVTTIGISLSDPDVFPYNGKIYADKFDVFYTNSKYSLTNEYSKICHNARIMPFAASKKHHYYMPEVERKYDVVIVAHAREDRLPIVEKIEKMCKVGTYGKGWKNSLGVVNGKEHVKAINSGKMYVSFSQTKAGFNNVKVGLFEAMACNQVVITSYMDELQDYFEIGKEIVCYKNETELYELISYLLSHDKERELIRQRGYRRFIKDHTYWKRWDDVIKYIYIQKNFL